MTRIKQQKNEDFLLNGDDFTGEKGSIFIPEIPKDLDEQAWKQIDEFNDLLKSLDSSLDKKKALWKQIYDNAITDRKNAYIVFTDLYQNVHGNAAEHAVHGQTLSKYMERMSKGTDQLLKLVELVAAAEEKIPKVKEAEVSEDDIYSQIENKKKH